MKKRAIFVMICFFILCIPTFAQETALEIPQASELIEEAPISTQEFASLTLEDIVQSAKKAVSDALRAPLRLLAKLCGVLILAAIARVMTEEFPASTVTAAVDIVAALTMFSLACVPILGMMQLFMTMIEQCKTYLASFAPVFATVMVSAGQPSSAAIYGGIFFSAVNLIQTLLCTFAIPGVRIMLAFDIVSALDSGIDTNAISAAIEKGIKWMLGLCATVFGALLSLQTVLAQATDNLAMKTGKFIVGSSVPVVGRAVSDALGSVVAGVQLIKGTLGFAAISVIAAIFLPFLLECVIYTLLFTVSSFVASSLGNKSATAVLTGFARCTGMFLMMSFLFVAMVIVSTLVMMLLGGGSI